MAHAMTYATVAAVSIVGAGVGVLMGRAAISEINPVYYQAPPSSRSFADLSPATSRTVAWSSDVPADYWTNDLNLGGRSYCHDCSATFVEQGSAAILPSSASLSHADEGQIAPERDETARYPDFPDSREETALDRDSFPEEQAGAAPYEENAPVGM